MSLSILDHHAQYSSRSLSGWNQDHYRDGIMEISDAGSCKPGCYRVLESHGGRHYELYIVTWQRRKVSRFRAFTVAIVSMALSFIAFLELALVVM